MKNIFLAAGFMLAAATGTFAYNKIDREDRKESRIERKEARKEHRTVRRAQNRNVVSTLTKNSFAMDFHNAENVLYEKTKNFEEVSFVSGNKALRAFYDTDNHLIGTTQKKSFSDLPENAQNEITKKYADYSVAEVIRFDNNESNNTDMILYGTSFDDADNYFAELKNEGSDIVVKVDLEGGISYFSKMK